MRYSLNTLSSLLRPRQDSRVAHVEPLIPSFEEQVQALRDRNLFLGDVHRAEVWYDGALKSKIAEISNGAFAKDALSQLPAWSREYSERFQLLRNDVPLEEFRFGIKPFDRAINKLYRKNVLKPVSPPIAFGDCLSSLEDLIRDTIVCRFGDGPSFLATKLKELAKRYGVDPRVVERADDFGYYAIHFTFRTKVDVLGFDNQVQTIALCAELQLTTQLQASLRNLTHTLYEIRRMRPGAGDWKWDFNSPYFRPSYVGHTLHLLESLLIEMKTRNEEDQGKTNGS